MTEPQNPQGAEADDDDGEGSPLGALGLGVGACAFAGYLFYYFTNFEAGTEHGRRMWWVLALLYNLGGKWPPVALVGLIGLGGLGMGVRGLLAKKSG